MGAPVRFQKAIPGLKENAAVERREARRPALWAGSSLPLEGQAMPQGRPTGRRSGPRLSALRFPHLRMRRVRNRQFGRKPAGMRRAATLPHGSNTGTEEGMTISKFAHLTVHRHARAQPSEPSAQLARRQTLVTLVLEEVVELPALDLIHHLVEL